MDMMKKASDYVCAKAGVSANSMKGNLLSALISDLIYTPIITIVMVVLMIGAANRTLDVQIAANQDQITKLTQQQEQAEEKDPAITRQIEELNGAVKGMEQGKPSLIPALPVSLVVCFVVAYVVIFLIQPVYMKMIMKKYGMLE